MKWLTLPLVALVVSVSLSGLSRGEHDDPALPEHPASACQAPFHVRGAEWDFCWQQDDMRGQGLELNQVYFHGESVAWKIGFPFSITKYEQDVYGPFKDTLGESLIGGENPGFGRGSMAIHLSHCPRFFGAGVLLNDQGICVEHRAGPEPAVAIWARYDIFNYRFLQGYILDARGVVEPFVRLGGTLTDSPMGGASGTNHFHHMFWRIDLDIGESGNDGFQMFLRPDEAWNDWDPYTVWSPGEEQDPTGTPCSQFAANKVPPPCRGVESDGNFTLVDPLAGLPAHCRQQVLDGVAGWCKITEEAAATHHPALFTKWRVHDQVDTNRWDRGKSFESTSQSHHDVPIDGNYTTFDALALQHKGDSQEIGFEVPPFPIEGDSYLHAYLDAPESLQDPVTWLAVHAYHDTRDEDTPTMTYHHVSFTLEPRSFLDRNLGENTYTGAPSTQPPGGVNPEPCVGAICVG